MKTKEQTESKLNQTPWEFAVLIYISVLENPDAPASGRMEAREEIMRLARLADKMNQATTDHPQKFKQTRTPLV